MKLMIGICMLVLATSALGAFTTAPPTAAQATAITINPKLRKALLEALSFDGEESTESEDEEATTASGVTEDFEDSTNNPSFVKIHTFAIDGDRSDENEVIKTIIITRPRTTLTPPKHAFNGLDEEDNQVNIKFNKTPNPNLETDRIDNLQAGLVQRSFESRKEKKEEKLKKKASEKSVTKPITPQTITTTLPPPVTNADGENIEKVAKNDVKIQQAPLLAAFTVQQDFNGQPKHVISLFNNPQKSDIDSKQIINMEFKASQQVTQDDSPSTNGQSSFDNSNQQLLSSFELKQRQLEEQIRFLQERQREQDEIIRRHQILQDQQNRFTLVDQQRLRFEEDQRQRNRFEEDQRQRQRFEQEQQFLIRQQQAQAPQQPQTQALQAPPAPTPNVQFIQSIPLSHTVGISVQQQLPFKGPTEFNPDKPQLQKPFAQLQQQFQFRQQNPIQINPFSQQQRNAGFGQQQQPNAQPLIQQQEVRQIADASLSSNLELPQRQAQQFIQFTPLPTNLELPQRPFQTFNSAPLSVLPSITEVAPQGQGRTRVFRNDALQTGNFGVQIQQQQIDPINYSLDNQLQSFLRQSGVNTRSTDDFRIISQILSSNHGIPNQFNANRFH